MSKSTSRRNTPAQEAPVETATTEQTSQSPAKKITKTQTDPLIATARIKNAVNGGYLNKAGNEKAKVIKDSLAKFPEEDNSDEKRDLVAQKVALSKSKIRFSLDSSTTLAAASTHIAKTLISLAIAQAKLANVKTANIKHLYAANLRTHALYPLLSGLPSFESQLYEHELRETQKKLDGCIANIQSRLEKEFCKKYDVKRIAAEKPAEKPAKSENPKVKPAEVPTDDRDVSFIHYVVAICVDVKSGDVGMRTSKKFQKHISDIVLDFARRTAVTASRIIGYKNNKTINSEAIIEAITIKFTENASFTDSFVFTTVMSPAKTDAEGVVIASAAPIAAVAKTTTYTDCGVESFLKDVQRITAEYPVHETVEVAV